MSETKVNREYKDRLFKFIFGNPEKREWTLSLYNAMNGSHYTNPEDIKLNTIENAVYLSMKNDVSFLIADTFNFYEHQSGFNPNMPMRMLIYAGMIYDGYIETCEDYHRFSSRQQHAPTPKCVCFYNGYKDTPDRMELRLSDSFAPGSKPDIEVRVTMINVNYGHNAELLKACKPLEDYAYFVYRVRRNRSVGNKIENSIDLAIDEQPDDSLIKPFLIKNKAEVKSMFITEYDEQRAFAETKAEGWIEGREEGKAEGRKEGREEGRKEGREEGRKEGREEGREEGRAEGKIQAFAELVKDGLLTISQAAEKVHMTVPEFEAAIQTI